MLAVALQVVLVVLVAAGAVVSGFSFAKGDKTLAVLPVIAVVAIGLGLMALTRFSAFVLLLLAVRPALDLFKLSSNATGTAVGNTASQRGLDPSSIVGVLFLLAAVVWLAGRARSGQLVPGSRLRTAMFAFLATCVLSVVASVQPQASALEALRIATVVMMFVVLEQLITSRAAMIRVMVTCYVALLVPLGYTVFGMLTGSPSSEVRGSFTRLTGPFNQSNTFARYLAFLLIFGIAVYPYVKPRLKLLFGAMLALSSVFMLLTLTRTAILGSVAGLVVLAVAQKRKVLIGGLVAMALAALIALPGLAARFGTLDAGSTPQGTPTGNTLVWRLHYWTEVIPLANSNPVTGIGLASTQYETDAAKQPHNDFIRAYVETGLLGLACYVSMLAALVGSARRAVQRAPKGSLESGVAAGALGCAVCFVLGSMAANVMSNVVSLWYLIAFAAAAAYVSRTYAPGPHQLQRTPDVGVVPAKKA
ncbi:MAG: O-antigen ligase family protein [Marmoricola sp.]